MYVACTGALLVSVIEENQDKEATRYKVSTPCIKWPHDKASTTRALNPTNSAHSGGPKAGWLSAAFSTNGKEATMHRVCAPCIKEPNYKASDLNSDTSKLKLWEVEVSHMFKAKANAQGSGRHNYYMVSETASKVCVFFVKGPYYKASDLDSDTGRLRLWGVENNQVLTAKADAQDSG